MSLEVKIKKDLGSFVLDVEFETSSGISALLGASGCGKSLTLKCIAGIIKPDSGRIVLNGRVLYDSEKRIDIPPQKRGVGYLFQNYALFPNMNVEQNIACGIHDEKDKKIKKEKVHNIIEKMQISGLEKHKPHQLSGGQQQRVALARILIGNPDILLLDEPFSALDSYLKEYMISEVKKILLEYDKDMLLVTHSREEAYALCSEIMVMSDGLLSRKGPKDDVFYDPRTIPAAILTGCKNVYKAEKYDDTTINVVDLGIKLKVEKKVEDGVCAVGIRAHHFDPSIEANKNEILITTINKGPFDQAIKFRYPNQLPDTPDVWWTVERKGDEFEEPRSIGIPPDKILVLYEKEE